MKIFILLFFTTLNCFAQKQGIELELLFDSSVLGDNYSGISQAVEDRLYSKLGRRIEIVNQAIDVKTVEITIGDKLYNIKPDLKSKYGFSVVDVYGAIPKTMEYSIGGELIRHSTHNDFLRELSSLYSDPENININALESVLAYTYPDDHVKVGGIDNIRSHFSLSIGGDIKVESRELVIRDLDNETEYTLKFITDPSIVSEDNTKMGVEIVTSPLDQAKHADAQFFNTFAEVIDELKLERNNTTGMHLHQEIFSDSLYGLLRKRDMKEVRKGLEKLETVLTNLTSMKSGQDLTNYQRMLSVFKTRSNNYVKEVNQDIMLMLLEQVRQLRAETITLDDFVLFLDDPVDFSKYRDINFSALLEKGTIEFRFMDVPSNKERLLFINEFLSDISKKSFSLDSICNDYLL